MGRRYQEALNLAPGMVLMVLMVSLVVHGVSRHGKAVAGTWRHWVPAVVIPAMPQPHVTQTPAIERRHTGSRGATGSAVTGRCRDPSDETCDSGVGAIASLGPSSPRLGPACYT
jgi:hypothetical protein